ncbi:unnamed protein product [Soboliphyme baturini]|uniref:RRM domain-containing protein n=1 Tax=Soboliphyme baturini TaxID=241478 RepID=A0A183IWZ3_9BILA|nr:unnamed protein product [Soboliphyme baturini]
MAVAAVTNTSPALLILSHLNFILEMFGESGKGGNCLVTDPSELNCRFDHVCHWLNGTSGLEDDGQWSLATAISLNPADIPHTSYVKTNQKCSREPERKVDQHLKHTINQPSMITFSYWRSSVLALLKVCTRQPSGFSNPIHCKWDSSVYEIKDNRWQSAKLLIPASYTSFEVRSIILLFDKPAENYGNTDHRNSPTLPPKDQDSFKSHVLLDNTGPIQTFELMLNTFKCPQIACAFDKDMCLFYGRRNAFKQSRSRVGYSVFGIESDFSGTGGFAYASSSIADRNTFMLFSQPFFTEAEGVITFQYYLPNTTGTLTFCDQDICKLIARNSQTTASRNLFRWKNGKTQIKHFEMVLHHVGELEGQPKGYCFVSYASMSSAENALQKLSGAPPAKLVPVPSGLNLRPKTLPKNEEVRRNKIAAIEAKLAEMNTPDFESGPCRARFFLCKPAREERSFCHANTKLMVPPNPYEKYLNVRKEKPHGTGRRKVV